MPRSESPVSNAAERPGRVHARCLLFAAATGSLLQIDADEVRLAGWARRGASLPAAPAPSGPEARISALERCGEALEAGFAAASGAGDLAAAEASHYCDTRAQVCALLSEEREAEAERLRASAVVVTPGSGFGPAGDGFIRCSAFGHRANILDAAQRLKETFSK